MAYDNLVAMHVTDPVRYARYRELIAPILRECGGGFRYDIQNGEVLRSEAAHPITRMFVISFPDRDVCDRFFADERYQAVRKEFFEPAVAAFTVVAVFEREP